MQVFPDPPTTAQVSASTATPTFDAQVVTLHDLGAVHVFVLLLVAAVGLLGYALGRRTRPAPEIEYRFIPRTFEEEQNMEPQALAVFRELMGTSTLLVE